MDDENINVIRNTDPIEQLKKIHFKCHASNKHIQQSLIEDSNFNCDYGYIEIGWCENENLDFKYIKTNILFQQICDEFIDLLPVMNDCRKK